MPYVVSGYWDAGYVISDSASTLVSDLQGVAPSPIIELYQLTLNALQHGIDTTYYFHAGVASNYADIVWNGAAYQALPIQADGFAWSGRGQLPRPTLRVSNIMGTITQLLATLPSGLEGAKVTRIRTLARFIDEYSYVENDYWDINYVDTGDPYAEWPQEIYYIDRRSAETRDVVEFELASIFDMTGVRAPKRQCLTRCQWVYRSPECSYSGTNYFDASDNPVGNLSQDVCGKRISSCEKRFGANNELPYGGYPGIGTYFA